MSFLDVVNNARPDPISHGDINEEIVAKLSKAICDGIKNRIVAIAKNTPKDKKLEIDGACLSLGDGGELYNVVVKSESKRYKSLFGTKEYTEHFYEITDLGKKILQRLKESLASDGISIEDFFMGFGEYARTDSEDSQESCGPLWIAKAYGLYGKYPFPVETTAISSYYYEFIINKTKGDYWKQRPFLLISFSFSE